LVSRRILKGLDLQAFNDYYEKKAR
jgi:hypothetical protein